MSLKTPPVVVLHPNPSTEPPLGYAYPQALPHTIIKDNRYQRGYVGVSNFDPCTKEQLKLTQLRIVTPPGAFRPQFVNGTFQRTPVAGGLKLLDGISMCQTINGDKSNIVTTGGYRTLDSMKEYLGDGYPEFYSAFERLACNSWGCDAQPDRPAREPFFTLKGLKRNERSLKNVPPGRHDGSYNLASTVGKGEGQGCVMPSVQAMTPQGASQIKEILNDLAFLGDKVLRTMISRFEYEVNDFNAKDNNIFGFGGLKPYATGCQANVSSATDDLAKSIGIGQGSWHPDEGDDYGRWTIGTILFRLPPGM